MYCDQWATCCVCDQRAPSLALPGQAQTHRFFSPEALPPSAYTVLRAPAPSGLPGVSPGPGGATSVDTYDQALLDQYNVTLCPDIQDYFASGSAQATKDAECLKLLLLSPRGIERTVREDGSAGLQLRVCVACQQALKRQHKKPPTFAIANKFFMGSYLSPVPRPNCRPSVPACTPEQSAPSAHSQQAILLRSSFPCTNASGSQHDRAAGGGP